jgi:hypothetical protein
MTYFIHGSGLGLLSFPPLPFILYSTNLANLWTQEGLFRPGSLMAKLRDLSGKGQGEVLEGVSVCCFGEGNKELSNERGT